VEQQKKFQRRAKHERELLSLIRHVAGRTACDHETALKLNPALTYHHLDECLRPCFYQDQWDIEKCEPKSIFLGQGDYPLKGFHCLLEALPLLLERFPQAHLYVAGADIFGTKPSYKLSAYGMYLKSLISRHRLEGSVTMLGKLDEGEMKERFLKSSLYICPSTMENSPNSVCEAQLLGVPVVAAAVGGIPSLIEDGETGFLYEPGDSADMISAIAKAWDSEAARRLCANAAAEARKRHDRAAIFASLVEIYRSITGD
jgi:glycosyltransferase involved in cell wall biosynthesis